MFTQIFQGKDIFRTWVYILLEWSHYDAVFNKSERPEVKFLEELQKQSQLNPAQGLVSTFPTFFYTYILNLQPLLDYSQS
jgi:hypothetical protein